MIRIVALIGFLSMSNSAQAVTLSQHIQQKGSHASLTLELPFIVIQQLANQSIKPMYSGSKDDPTNALKNDQLTWNARPTPLSISEQSGNLVAKASAAGTTRIKGKLGGVIKVSVSTDLAVDAQVSINPTVNSDWSVSPNATGGANLREADLYGVSIRGLLQPDLNQAFNKALAEFNAKPAVPGFLKNHAQDFWNKICGIGSADNQIGIIPGSIAIMQPKVSSSGLRVTLVVSGEASSSKSGEAPCPALPETLILLDKD